MKIICKVCKKIICEDTDLIDNSQRYIECCNCGRVINNPVWNGEEKVGGYIG